MLIQIKNIDFSERMSEETFCFTASLWVNGKKIGDVSNRGHGGCDEFRGDQAAYDTANKWCKENLPKSLVGGEEYDTDLEGHVNDMMSDWLLLKDLKRTMSKRALFSRADIPLSMLAYKPLRKPDDYLLAAVKEKHPNAIVLNDMPLAEAFAIYKAESHNIDWRKQSFLQRVAAVEAASNVVGGRG